MHDFVLFEAIICVVNFTHLCDVNVLKRITLEKTVSFNHLQGVAHRVAMQVLTKSRLLGDVVDCQLLDDYAVDVAYSELLGVLFLREFDFRHDVLKEKQVSDLVCIVSILKKLDILLRIVRY